MTQIEPLTLFAAPRAFDGPFERLQMNTLRSWAALRPRPEILVFGAEPGTREACEELGLRWMPEVALTASGLPLMSDLFARGERAAATDLLAYVNIDIILMQDLVEAIAAVHVRFSDCVLIGSPWNVPVPYDLDTAQSDWRDRLERAVRSSGKPPTNYGADLFVYRREYFRDVPPLALGRFFFDTWLISRARFCPVPVVDITDAAFLVHQDHGGSSHARKVRPTDPDTLWNISHTRWWDRVTFRLDIPLVLSRDGVLTKRPRRGRFALALRLAFRHSVVWLLERFDGPLHRLGLDRLAGRR